MTTSGNGVALLHETTTFSQKIAVTGAAGRASVKGRTTSTFDFGYIAGRCDRQLRCTRRRDAEERTF